MRLGKNAIHRPSPALVIACAALVIALSGTGYAATKIERQSIDTAQLRRNAVVSSKVKNGSLSPQKFAASTRGAEGPPGETGATGTANSGFVMNYDPQGFFPDGTVLVQTVRVPSAGFLNLRLSISVSGFQTERDYYCPRTTATLTFRQDDSATPLDSRTYPDGVSAVVYRRQFQVPVTTGEHVFKIQLTCGDNVVINPNVSPLMSGSFRGLLVKEQLATATS